MKKLYIVTGVSKGLGASLVEQIVQNGDEVITLGRQKHADHKNTNFIFLDLSKISTVSSTFESLFDRILLNDYEYIYLINNAATIDPIGPSDTLSADVIQQSMNVNLLSPITLSSSFLNKTRDFKGLRFIVNISSGVAERPTLNWSTYSAAKAGLRIFTMGISDEFSTNKNTKIISFNPGLMDTEMQNHIRGQSENKFSDVQRFIQFKKQGQLVDPTEVAKALLKLIENPAKLLSTEYHAGQLLKKNATSRS